MTDAENTEKKAQANGAQHKRQSQPKSSGNKHRFRESWLHAAIEEMRPYFIEVGLPLPANIRAALGFPSTGRKGKRLGECWHSDSSDDATYEIFIRADLAAPAEVLAALVKELVHAALPSGTQHGKLFKGAAIKVGLQGRMREAHPGHLLQERLMTWAETLGPLPHASLHIEQAPLVAVAPLPAIAFDVPKKQRGRLHKAECSVVGCGYLVRVATKHVRSVGAPHCPKHGAMSVTLPQDDQDEDADSPDAEARLNASEGQADAPELRPN